MDSQSCYEYEHSIPGYISKGKGLLEDMVPECANSGAASYGRVDYFSDEVVFGREVGIVGTVG